MPKHLKGKTIMKKFTKITSIFLAFIMIASAVCISSPVSAASKYEYNESANAMVVNAKDDAIVLDDSSMGLISKANTEKAEAIIFNAGQSTNVSISITDAILSKIANGAFEVRIVLKGGKAYLSTATVAELSEKVAGKLELSVSLGAKSALTIKADSAAVNLKTPIVVVADNAVDGATTANAGTNTVHCFHQILLRNVSRIRSGTEQHFHFTDN